MSCRLAGLWKKLTICLAKASAQQSLAPSACNGRLAFFGDNKLVLEEVAGDGMPEDILNGGYAEAEEFIRALSHGDAPHPSIDEVAPSVMLCLTMAKSLEGTR